MRAAATAASTPAWPAPITITSNVIDPSSLSRSFPYAESLEDVLQHILARVRANDFSQAAARRVQIGEQEFFGRGRLGVPPRAPATGAFAHA